MTSAGHGHAQCEGFVECHVDATRYAYVYLR